jgi:hypothetical protein
VTFTESFTDPIVVATGLSSNSADPAVVRIQHVDADGFDMRVQEWDYLNDWHPYESVSYIVMERGSYTLTDGTRIEAERMTTNQTTNIEQIDFAKGFAEVPVLFTSVTSMSSAATLSSRVDAIGVEGFGLQLQGQEATFNGSGHNSETVSYIAWEPSAGTIAGVAYDVARADSEIGDTYRTVLFDELDPFSAGPVQVLADMQTMHEADPATLRCRNKDLSGVECQVDEEQSLDAETHHTPETVGYIVFAQAA